MEKGQATVFRFNPEEDKKYRYEIHEFPFVQGMSVLDVALYIYENIDPTFTFSYSCSNSHCGLCAAKINGRPGLMCRESATQKIRLEPLDNLPVIRDLMVDRSEYDENLDNLRLFLDRITPPEKEPERIDLRDHNLFKVASRCVECFSCLSDCPAFRDGRHEFLGPAGFVQLARHAFDPRDELNREVVAYSAGIYNCTNCGKCAVICPHDISPRDNITLLRAQVVASGEAPESVRTLIEMVKASGKAMLHPSKKKSFLQEHVHRDKGRVGLFVGCTFDYDPQLQPAALGALRALEMARLEVAVPAKQICCGLPLYEVGASGKIEELVLKNVDVFQEAGCSQVVTICSGCGWAGKRLWPQIYRDSTGRDLPFEVVDFSEMMALHAWRLKDLQKVSRKVTYHDACLLNRGLGIRKEPRQLIEAIPGVKLVEMPEADHCCGGGGGVRVHNLELAQRILKRKMEFVKMADVEAVVTCCPTCIRQLRMGLSRVGLRGVKVLHPAALLSEVMGK
jgi:fumarate reductase (CoM/CoB) subunit B